MNVGKIAFNFLFLFFKICIMVNVHFYMSKAVIVVFAIISVLVEDCRQSLQIIEAYYQKHSF